MMNTHIVEPEFGLNSFQKPKTVEDEAAMAKTILMILFGRPGVFPSIPQIGMHIQDLFYKFDEEIDVNVLKAQLATQCSLVSEVMDSDGFDIQKLDDNGKTVILFAIPTVSDSSDNVLVIGVTTNDSNSVIYNFELLETDFYDD